MRYGEAIQRLFGLSARGMRPGIERMQQALAYRGLDPEDLPPIIQVAGTNGKGSVSVMLASALSAAGYRTGLFTSPHLHRFTERICIDGRPLGVREAARRIEQLLDAFEPRGRRRRAEGAPEISFFELSTLMAAEVFRDHRCDVAVFEVGLGGRLDATTALPASVCVITRIALDHTQYLGDTLEQIAREKAGVIRPSTPVIVGSREPRALRVISEVARERRAPLLRIDRDFRALVSRRSGPAGRVGFEVGGSRLPPVRLALPGDHQRDNAACAVAGLVAFRGLGHALPNAAIARGLRDARWPGRLEELPGRPRILLDAAHNGDGCRALAAHLARQPRRPRALIFGVMADKDYPAMLQALTPQVDAVFYVRPNVPRAAQPEALIAVQPGETAGSALEALRRARRRVGPNGTIVIAGSIFLIAEARAHLLQVPSDPPIRL